MDALERARVRLYTWNWLACTREIGSLVHVTLPVAAWICVAAAGNGMLNCDVVWQAQHQCDIWWQAQSIEASW